MHRTTLMAMIASAVLVGACNADASPSPATASTAPTIELSPSPVESPTASASTESTAPETSSLPTGVPTALDPCQLVTSQEASQLSGGSFGAGVEGTTSGNGKTCVYGGNTLNVFNVIVGQTPDVATAQAGKAEAQAALQKLATKGVQITQLPSLGDGGVYMSGGGTISGATINISAIYVLKGTVFFGFSDLLLGRPAPTSDAMQAQAQTVLGRLP